VGGVWGRGVGAGGGGGGWRAGGLGGGGGGCGVGGWGEGGGGCGGFALLPYPLHRSRGFDPAFFNLYRHVFSGSLKVIM